MAGRRPPRARGSKTVASSTIVPIHTVWARPEVTNASVEAANAIDVADASPNTYSPHPIKRPDARAAQ